MQNWQTVSNRCAPTGGSGTVSTRLGPFPPAGLIGGPVHASDDVRVAAVDQPRDPDSLDDPAFDPELDLRQMLARLANDEHPRFRRIEGAPVAGADDQLPLRLVGDRAPFVGAEGRIGDDVTVGPDTTAAGAIKPDEHGG